MKGVRKMNTVYGYKLVWVKVGVFTELKWVKE